MCSLSYLKTHAFMSESKIQTLENEVEQLKNKKRRLQEDVDEAAGSGDEINRDVTGWLRDADKAIGEAEELLQHINEAKKKCSFGFCPYLKTSYDLSQNADKRAFAITQLYQDRRSDFVSSSPSPKQIVEASTLRGELLPSRVLLLNQIMDSLKDPSLNMIGIYGPGGVGKTHLAERVCARARDEELFDNVIMIPISRFPNLRGIQAEIAALLGLKFDAEEVPIRASQLCQSLKEAKLLVILDDVWQKLDLHAIGIPIADEGLGCKLLVSSRRKDLLSSEMGSQKDFLVDVLSEDSWSVFQTAAPRSEDPEFNAIATSIAKKCPGLPLLVELISLQLKYEKLDAWADMLRQLPECENEELPERVSKLVESSFLNLLGDELKALFLLCASYEQHNLPIQNLLIHCMGLRLLRNVTTIKEARSAMYSMILDLIEGGWLLDGDLGGHLKLHDAVRDAAISIASRCHNCFIGASEMLRYWPNKDCTRISLRVCDTQHLPTSLQCPKAELFLLSSEDLCLEFPDLFFEGLAELKVVGFTGIGFVTKLPSSLGCLRNLDALSLHRCRLDSISVIGELAELKFLSFAESDIVELPREMDALTQLKLLHLTNCSKLRVVPTNVIAKLISLEELLMRGTCVRWDEKGNVSLLELTQLSCLSSLEVQIVNPKSIPRFSSFYHGLHRCKIIIGEEHGPEKSERSRMLKLVKVGVSFHLEDVLGGLLRWTEDLYLDEASALNYLTVVDLLQLSQLSIKNDCGIEHVFRLDRQFSCEVFRGLNSLCLDNLDRLNTICDGPLERLCSLRSVKVSNCGKLKNLFSFSTARVLPDLQEIEVESCENMETIIGEGSEDIEFNKLSSLKLKNLPHLEGFCIKKENTENLQLLFHDMISFPMLKILEVTKCWSLKYVFTISNAQWLQKLERLKIDDCESMEEIIWHEGNAEAEEEGINKIAFHKLSYVSIRKLAHLKSFSCGFTVEFPSLVEFSIYSCPAMVINISSVGENVRFYYLDGKKLKIQNGYGSQHTFDLNEINCLESLHFDELRSLRVSNFNKLRIVFSFSSSNCYLKILELELRSCHKMEAIVGGRSEGEISELTQLRYSKLENLPHLLGFSELKEVSFPNLTSLVLQKCNTLKYVFTLSMVKCLVQLTKLEISNCELVESIIQSNEIEESKEEIIDMVVFHRLNSLSLYGLRNAKMFGCGYEIEFPLLRDLFVECPAMENFVSKFSDRNNNYNGDECFFNELVTFSNLESVILRNMDTFRYLWDYKFILDDSFSNLKSLDVANCSRLSVVFPASAFRRIQKLEVLYLSCCDRMEEIFQSEENELVEINIAEEFALRDVQIMNLASLKYVFPNTMADSLLRLEQFEIQNCNVHVIIEELQELEACKNKEVVEFPQLFSLKLKNLPYLSGFCSKQDEGFGVRVSFPSLKDLELYQCKSFKYVFTTTMANSLMQLEKLEINSCELVEEIVRSRQFDEVESIVFPKLVYLSLEKLPNLKTFDFGCPVEFQSLKELAISHCPVLKNFVSKYVGNESDKCLFNELVTFSNLERMKVSHAYSFDYLWDGEFIADDSFLKLESLIIEYCSKLSVVFPSNIGRRFQGLETLHLCCCSKVEEVYQYDGKSLEDLITSKPFCLQDLYIWNLPSLKYIWRTNPPKALTFDHLRSVKVVSCKDLVFVFPKSIARRLPQLQHLKIGESEMEAIIGNTDSKASKIVVPQLNVLQLENLFQMRNLCKGPYTFKCPELKLLDVYGCNELMNFCSEIRCLQLSGSAYGKEKSLSFVNKKVICNLEELTLDGQCLKLLQRINPRAGFSKLKQVTLRSLDKESIPLLFGFLRRCSLKKLVFTESYLEEIFLLDDEETMPEHLMLQNLEVVGDDNLKHIFKKGSGLNPILGKLRTLKVELCECMINIAPSTAFLENLTSLNVSACFNMKNLVTVSTVNTMKNLRELKVSKCSMMEEIVENNTSAEYVGFNNLKFLQLSDLPTLNSFSSGIYDLEFPLLKQVVVKNCFTMRNFCRRQVWTPKLQAIQFQGEECWKGDLNATIAYLVKSRVVNTKSWET